MRLLFVSPMESDADPWARRLAPALPGPLLKVEMTGSPTFLGNPYCASAPLQRPRSARARQAFRRVGTAPADASTRAPTLVLSRFNHAASALAVYASQYGLPRHHARLASGHWPGSTGRASYPQGSDERFPSWCFAYIISSSSPKPRGAMHQDAPY